jgi:Leucine-rich repeat (LRR) protein
MWLSSVAPPELVVWQVADSVNLSGYGIASATMLDVSAFENVIALTLAHNRLTTLVCFGLERLSKLQKLDVHDNSVEYVHGRGIPLFWTFVLKRLLCCGGQHEA